MLNYKPTTHDKKTTVSVIMTNRTLQNSGNVEVLYAYRTVVLERYSI